MSHRTAEVSVQRGGCWTVFSADPYKKIFFGESVTGVLKRAPFMFKLVLTEDTVRGWTNPS
jgi:hypothetical protein